MNKQKHVGRLALGILSFFFISLASLYPVHAAIFWGRIHRHYVSPRALGMGDAFTAVADDYAAWFYNPAGLSRLKEHQINLSIDASLSDSFSKFFSELTEASKLPQSQQFNAYYSILTQNYGNNFGARLGLFQGVWAAPGWAVAVIPADITMDMTVVNQAFPTLGIRFFGDTTLALSYAKRVLSDDWGGKVDWGVTVKGVHRAYMNLDFNAIDLALNSNVLDKQNLSAGYAFDLDYGILYSPFLSDEGWQGWLHAARPTFSFVIRNILGGEFQQSSSVGGNNSSQRPEPLYRTFDFGSRWEYPEWSIFRGRGVLDVRHIGHPQWTLRKGLHLGFEFDWDIASWWRGQYRFGLGQGYLSAGASALFAIFRLDLVTFGEELGVEPYTKENRVYMVRMNLDF